LGVSISFLFTYTATDRFGKFLRGDAYERASTRTFFARMAVVAPSGETHLSGSAFRNLAQLQDESVRTLLCNLPPREWNDEG
jgi:hypothetical protein